MSSVACLALPAGCTSSIARRPAIAEPANGGCALSAPLREELARAATAMGMVPVDKGADYDIIAAIFQCFGQASDGEAMWVTAQTAFTFVTAGILPTVAREHAGLSLSVVHDNQLVFQHRSGTYGTTLSGWLAFPSWVTRKAGEPIEVSLVRHLVQLQLVELDQQGGLP